MDHLQRPEHPSGARAILTSQQAQEGWALLLWQQRLGGHHWGYAMTGSPCQVQEARATWSWWPDGAPRPGGSQALERRPAQCSGKMLEVGTVDLGSHGESGQLCGQNQTMECSPHPMGHPTLPTPCSEAHCRAEGAEGSPAW